MKAAPMRTPLLIVAGLLVGAFVTVFALTGGPDPAPLPQMVAYSMPDGREIFVQSHEVSLTDWNRCYAAGACAMQLRPPAGRPDGQYPATGLSFVDASEYLAWMNTGTGQAYRLPTLEEWSVMAAPVLPAKPDPIFTDPNLTWASAYLTEGLGSRRLEVAGSYSVTVEGIADLDGNVWEWTQSCFAGAGQGLTLKECPAFYVMGEHEAVMSFLVRDPARGGCAVGSPPAHLGMRLVSDRAPQDG